MKIDDVRFDSHGLVPAIVQDAGSGEVLTLAYMNRQSLEKSIETGETWFYSRSRKELWHKGETSGNVQQIVDIQLDCDGDALLVRVKPAGPACHTGQRSCFYQWLTADSSSTASLPSILAELYDLIRLRQKDLPEGSYTAELFRKGIAEIARKVGEEGVEVTVASLSESKDRVVSESGDLLYHLLVLLVAKGISLDAVAGELEARRK
jgi:phosphoribosyl-ATP pyrophosphohydrolase/phosphoribosyl-AMP cyclohydrolase